MSAVSEPWVPTTMDVYIALLRIASAPTVAWAGGRGKPPS
jgi:hypothetical protein